MLPHVPLALTPECTFRALEGDDLVITSMRTYVPVERGLIFGLVGALRALKRRHLVHFSMHQHVLHQRIPFVRLKGAMDAIVDLVQVLGSLLSQVKVELMDPLPVVSQVQLMFCLVRAQMTCEHSHFADVFVDQRMVF